LCDEEMPGLDDLLVVPVEEREQQGPDVRPVDVGVAHEDDRVVAELREVLVVLPDARAEGGDEQLDLLRGEHLVEPGLLDVQDLSPERQDRLVPTVASLLGGAAGGVALDDEELGERRVALLAIGELPREPAPVERPLATREVLRLPRRLAHAGGLEALEHDPPRLVRMLFEVEREAVVPEGLDRALPLAV